MFHGENWEKWIRKLAVEIESLEIEFTAKRLVSSFWKEKHDGPNHFGVRFLRRSAGLTIRIPVVRFAFSKAPVSSDYDV